MIVAERKGRPALAAVKDDGTVPAKKAAPRKRAPVVRKVETAAKRSQREGLVALRDRLGRAIDCPNTHPRDLANLARQQIAITEKIAAIDAASGKGKTGQKSVVADTPNESWDEDAV